MPKQVGILGSGVVGQTLAKGLKDLGHDVTIGRREAGKIDGWDGLVGTFEEVARNAELVILSVKGAVAEELITSLKDQLAGKTIIDTTNPIDEKNPAEDGVIHFFTSLGDSLMERLQQSAPTANFVKAFNSVGAGSMVNPHYETKPTMFICGDNKDAKQEVSKILDKLGWEVQDMGTAKAARAIEPLCILWCIPGFLENSWSHAFKLLKK